ncbi:hypothetical protein GPX89_26335 [Nocardia sp. ET3-3]|uniref:Uncharacterized protein n=1 Tax=Nocardia terrae TaxID=2675851 RepID=A0A7K1V2T7_9NOCA|nr:hypothetical protein [Nocardia terrae]MVU80759.1 hypothetical protein [Nocardia terrae]
MRTGGGFTAAGQARREAARMNAIDGFDAGMAYQQVARRYQVATMTRGNWWDK